MSSSDLNNRFVSLQRACLVFGLIFYVDGLVGFVDGKPRRFALGKSLMRKKQLLLLSKLFLLASILQKTLFGVVNQSNQNIRFHFLKV